MLPVSGFDGHILLRPIEAKTPLPIPLPLALVVCQ
jgi:hypothetical protein